MITFPALSVTAFSFYNHEENPQCLPENLERITELAQTCLGHSPSFYNFMSKLATSAPLKGCVDRFLQNAAHNSLEGENANLIQFYRSSLHGTEPSNTDFNPYQPILMRGDRLWTDQWKAEICYAQISAPSYYHLPSAKTTPSFQSFGYDTYKTNMYTLFQHGAFDPNKNKNTDHNYLSLAIQNVQLDLLKDILSHPLTDPNTKDGEGRTPLHLAIISKGHPELFDQLIQHPKLDPNIASSVIEGQTELPPIFIAVIFGKEHMVQSLLDHPCIDPFQKVAGKTILDLSRDYESPAIYQMIKQKLDELT